MAKYLVHGNYLQEGLKGLMQDGGSRRREAVENLVGSLGGTVEACYFAFGSTDIFVVVDMPNNTATAAASLVASSTGAVATSVTVLLTPEEIDDAVKMSPDYRPPGG